MVYFNFKNLQTNSINNNNKFVIICDTTNHLLTFKLKYYIITYHFYNYQPYYLIKGEHNPKNSIH